jgi:hypothetical protein
MYLTESDSNTSIVYFFMFSVVMVTGIAGAAILLSVVAMVIGFVYIKKYR